MTGDSLISRPVEVRSIPREGVDHRITATDEERARIVEAFELVDLPALDAEIRVRPASGKRIRVTGRVTADVVQTCVVSLVPVAQKVDEPIDMTFLPESEFIPRDGDEEIVDALGRESPEPFDGRTIDLGAVAAEHFALGLDPYPKAPGVEFTPPTDEDGAAGWAAALGRLAGKPGDKP